MKTGLADALRRLRESDAGQAAPDSLERKMVEAFRAHHVPAPSKSWAWLPVAIAASLLIAVASRMTEPVKVEAPAVPSVEAKAPAAVDAAPVIKAATIVKPKQAKPRPRRAAPAPPGEEQFIGIPYAPAFSPYDEGQVVRVSMPGSSARSLGFPVLTDRVQADVLLGNDGLARAIRVVSNSGRNTYR